jgi:hypothetical protein
MAPQHWPVLGCMLMVAVSGGLYMVPLYAILQERTNPMYRSRILAASNLCDSVFMVVASLISAIFLSIGMGVTDLFLVVAVLNLAVVAYARKHVA